MEDAISCPLFGEGERIPDDYFRLDSGAVATLEEMRQVTSGVYSKPNQRPTRTAQLKAFATFISSHSHILRSIPQEMIPIARNYAADGSVVEPATRLAEILDRPWIARDPRPALSSVLPACVLIIRDAGTSVKVAADASVALSSDSRGFYLWDLSAGALLREFPISAYPIDAMPLSAADGKIATTINDDNTISAWDISSGTLLKTLRVGSDVARHVCASADGGIVVVSYKNCFRVWDAASERCLREVGVCPDRSRIERLAMTADGRMAVTVAGQFRLFSEGRTWDIPNRVQVWDVASGECARTLTSDVNDIAVTPDGRIVVSANGDLCVWNVISEDRPEDHFQNEVAATDAIFAPDSELLLIPSYNDLRIEETSAGVSQTLQGHTDNIASAAWSPDGKLVISGAFDYHARVWDVSSGACLRVLDLGDHVNAASFSADGRFAITGSRTVEVWDLVTGERTKSVSSSAEVGRITSTASTPDDKLVVSANANCEVCVWKLAEEESGAKFSESDREYSEPAAQNCILNLPGHEDMILSIALTHDGRKAVTASIDCTVRVWDLISGECLHMLTGHTALIRRVALTPDGKTAVSASEDCTLRIWDLASGSCDGIYHAGRKVISVSAIRPSGEFACVTTGNDVHHLTLRCVAQAPPFVTAVRLFRFAPLGPTVAEEQEFGSSLLTESDLLPGGYDEEITARCLWCGQVFVPPIAIIDAIRGIMDNAGLDVDESPCMKLPAEAWDNASLVADCPHCHQRLRFNPFIVDNRDRYS